VTDPSGAIVAGAGLRVVETGTGAERRLQTDPRGYYQALRVSPGIYDLTASHPGFRDQVRRAVELGAGQSTRVDFQLQLGTAQDQVVVTAETPLLSTSSADWGGSIRREELETLPLNGRDMFDLSVQQPGASVPSNAQRTLLVGQGIKVSVNGARPNENSFQLDGAYINDATGTAPSSAAGRLLGVEGISEFRLITSPFSAEYGRSTGAFFTAVSRSGSNQFHGSAYEFFHRAALDAKNFFDDPDQPIPPLQRNQFGGMLAGPVRHDRLFFLGNYEGLRETSTSTILSTVPDADARQGIVPGTSRITVASAVRPYLNLYPLPNGQNFQDGTGEYSTQVSRQTREDYTSGKLDYLPSARLRLSGRYTFDNSRGLEPDAYQVFSYADISRYQFVNLEAQYTASPATVYSVHGGFSRVRNAETVSSSAPPELSFLPGKPLGSLQVTGLSDLGDSRTRARPRRFVVNHFPVAGDGAHMRGAHSLRFGAGFDRIQFNQISDLSGFGRYQFSSLANLLTAVTRSGELLAPGSDSSRGWRQNQYFGYVQDEYRVRPGLNLGLGVRYETYSTPVEVNNKVATLPDPVRDTKITLGGPLFRNPSHRNFAPRASVAWDPRGSGKTVVRLGAGIFFDLLGAREITVAGMRMPPFFSRLSLTRPPFPNLASAAALGGTASNFVEGMAFYLHQPYVAQFQASIERQLGRSSSLRLGYSGSRGVHLMGDAADLNPTSPVFLSGGGVFYPATNLRLNPNFGPIGMRLSEFNSYYHALLVGFERRWTAGLRLKANYTWGKSIDETSSVSGSEFESGDHVPTLFNFRQNRGPSDFDLRHVFSANFSYRLLPSKGPATWASRIARDWEIHGLTQVRTGTPFNPSVGFDRLRLLPSSGDSAQRPDLIVAPGTDLIRGDPQAYFNALGFGLPEAGFYGNLGRNVLTAPGLFTLDLAVHKVLFQRESQSLRLRVEGFNITNHPNFYQPSSLTLFNSSGARLGAAGRITDTTTPARQIQLAIRFAF
jgi:hypothetical protein